jgi:hypothetical protein
MDIIDDVTHQLVTCNNEVKCCIRCNESKLLDKFVANKTFCKDCRNSRVRELRSENKTFRTQQIENEIGKGNKKCVCCNSIQPVLNFKCRMCLDCVRARDRKYNSDVKIKENKTNRRLTDETFRLKHSLSSRIYGALKRKQKRTIEYLGCNFSEFYDWMVANFDDEFTIENYGSVWHVDHVIPLSHFDLQNEDEQQTAFNWRNTTPLLAKDNLYKNNRLDLLQIKQHLEKLVSYHREKNIVLPQIYIDLFAT